MGPQQEVQQGEITLLLTKWKNGEPNAFDSLVPLVYPTLRQIAAGYMRRERNPGMLQATSLVHELYFRLVSQKKAAWEDRAHFYTFSAKVMRMILVDHARGNQAQRRGGKTAVRVPLSDELPWVGVGTLEIIELNRALDALMLVDETKVQMVELRYFLGCTAEETATMMHLSKATVDRDLKYAKAWLFRHLDPASVKSVE